ncbi:FeoB-associated Cys-rich membrane protein [Flavobacterium sp. F-392]|uniref:FeoB-associated Cys-rich membrane protein n=1 Tax=Flavobacterium muglaense TaxID=2764716 RepID=A0A923MYS5_9FLAO|nr:FeoB-associated Cys-rich membrane protein [Flavobacterium muglaense]MBC5837484.1 FeoB-associated Cys-rich membrane protein [Flavobacterium muglaense]MBC5844012.1 FeoB-associated Cys-rich membrane protein [Flavobacterium muglaense]
MMVQEIIAFVILAVAVGFLIKKYFFKKKKTDKSCGTDDCGCH